MADRGVDVLQGLERLAGELRRLGELGLPSLREALLVNPHSAEEISDAIRESATELRANVRLQMQEDVKQQVEKVGVR